MDFALGICLNPLPGSGNGFGVVISESAYVTADFDCSELLLFRREDVLSHVLLCLFSPLRLPAFYCCIFSVLSAIFRSKYERR